MLGYEWGNHSSPAPQLIITDDHDPSSSSSSHHNHHRPIFDDPFSTPCTFPHDHPSPPSSSSSPFSLYNLPYPDPTHFSLYDPDPRAFSGASTYQQPHQHQIHLNNSTNTLSVQPGSGYPVLVPKPEPDYANRIGLNLGGRTYFASDDDLVSRLYRRSRASEPVRSPKCQAEGCNADLSHAKHYHRRHKVCEFHSKAATVIAAGLTQRFCQQCSRFHLLSEFDNGKRSCRKRLADHNRRRRKSHQTANRDQRTFFQLENAPSSSSQRSPSDSGANSTSSVTVAISSPRISFDSSFRQRSYE